MRNGALREPIRDLRNDLNAVARDAEALLRATANLGGERVQEARARTQETLQRTFDHLYNRRMQRQVRKLARSTDAYVRDHSWSIIGTVGAVAGVALLLALFANRRE